MVHAARPYIFLLFVFLLLVISGYQFSVSIMHGLVEQELRHTPQRSYSSGHYELWLKKEPLVKLLESWSPFNGPVLQNSARFYLLGIDHFATDPARVSASIELLQRALASIRLSILRQPIWPLAWMDLAIIKAALGEFDGEFQQAFAKALSTGAAERDVIRGMTETGFIYWRDLSAKNRLAFVAMLDTAVSRDQSFVIASAKRHDRMYIPCLLISKKELVAKHCSN